MSVRGPRASGALFVLASASLSGCIFFVRVGAGPSVDADGHRGGVIGMAAGASFGSTRDGILAPAYEQSFGVGRRQSDLHSTLAATVRAFGAFGHTGRFGLGGHLGLVLGRDPDTYRGSSGLTVGFGLRLLLAGQTAHFAMGSCGPSTSGDAYGVFLYADVVHDRVNGDGASARRTSFPIGIEFRINPAFDRDRDVAPYGLPSRSPDPPLETGDASPEPLQSLPP